MSVSSSFPGIQLMHDEDEDVMEGSLGDITRLWYWQDWKMLITNLDGFSGPKKYNLAGG